MAQLLAQEQEQGEVLREISEELRHVHEAGKALVARLDAPCQGVCAKAVREAPLRAEASPTGAVVARLYPGDLVEVLHEEGRWVRVRYFHARTAYPKEGWVNKDHLRRAC
ncbi:Bacterial SH3 domain protein [Calidithermus terrae]|nr:SH3 domain-containing protein [Calidithermus terrae]MWR20565.1 SH3 domain-containing protein [Helicobacter pylori]MWR36300.1 SH3 domain-containing protein [Helicobacter pylori]RIH90711.1 Bacterial SH3 domain protein [Calidithermus terrae]